MEHFIGRKDELKKLEEFYNGTKYKACSILGRRRIGKTTLIDEFVKDKDCLRIQFLDSTFDANMELLNMTMGEYLEREVRYSNTLEFFSDLAEYINGRKVVIVFDEFPYMIDCDETFPSVTQHFIDRQMGDSKLIICGSSVKTMEHEIGDYSRPLYGRTWEIRMEEMPISDCMQFHPGLSDEDQLKLYLTTGGIPLYCDVPKFDDYDDYVKKNILEPNSYFSREGEAMVERELSPKSKYIKILDAMRGRRNTINTISSRTEIDRDTCSDCLKKMIELKMVGVTEPMFGAPMKPKYFEIRDNMLAFHFMAKRRVPVRNGNPEGMLKAIRPMMSTEHGFMFENYCRNLIAKSYPVRAIGTWWGSGPRTDRWGNIYPDDVIEYDIDVAAEIVSGFNIVYLAVECKYTDHPVGFSVLNELDSSIGCLKNKRDVRRMIMAPSGFDDDLAEYAAENGILLVGLDMLLEKEPMPEI